MSGLGRLVPALAVTAALAGCSKTITAGPGIENGGQGGDFILRVVVRNEGSGFGRVDVDFPIGTVREACPTILGPGQSCNPSVRTFTRIDAVEVSVEAEPGSVFTGWMGGLCEGQSTECMVLNTASEGEAEYVVEPRFDLEAGGP